MGEMKSAYDRAMERAVKMGSLPPDDLKKQEEERMITVGRALSEKYLEHGHTKVLNDDIGKFRAGEKDVVSKGARLGLAQSLSFNRGVTLESLDRVAAGLRSLTSDKQGAIEKMFGSVKTLLDEMEAEMDRTYSNEFSRLEDERRGLLKQLGISGSAVAGVNVEGGSAWQQIEAGLRAQYNAKLEPLKRDLSQAVA